MRSEIPGTEIPGTQYPLKIGSKRVVWRYDPVILTSATNVDWYLEQVESIARQLGVPETLYLILLVQQTQM
ncbi:MAG: hypothetical protein BA864_01145 [Desulfuromonadales bacterium C00003093]|nr:MAG: hypothetical protein BA864_01145 [Desulfuromonadales bacterium C00003093]